MKSIRKIFICAMSVCLLSAGVSPVSAERHLSDRGTTIVVARNTDVSNTKTTSRIYEKDANEKKQKPGINTMKPWSVESADVGGTLIFSDSPEAVGNDGILYTDTIQGKARILYYHLNNTDANKKIAVILENQSVDDTSVVITRGAMGGPSDDYLDVGKITQTKYFGEAKHESIFIDGHTKRLLQSQMDQTVVKPGQLVYGVFDFTAKNPVRVTVVMYPTDTDPYSFVDTAKVLPKDSQRLRGTFAGMDRVLMSEKSYDPQRDGAVYVTIGDNKADRYRTGIDATDGSIVTNYGNYGVLYSIHIPTNGRERTSYYLSPRGGVYAGAMTARSGILGAKNLVLTPSGTTFFGEKPGRNDMADLGTYSNVSSLWFEYSPPGASNLPVDIILLPAK